MRDGGLRLGDVAVGVFHFLSRCHATVEQLPRPDLGRPGIHELRAGALNLGLLPGEFRASGRNVETHEQVALRHAVAFALGDLGDPRRFWRHDDQLGAWGRGHRAGSGNEGGDVAECGRLGRDRHDGVTFDFLRGRARTAGCQCGDQGGHGDKPTWAGVRHGNGAPMARSSWASAD